MKQCYLVLLALALVGCQEDVSQQSLDIMKEGTAIVKATCRVMASEPSSAEVCKTFNIEEMEVASKIKEVTKVYEEEKAKFDALNTTEPPLTKEAIQQ